MTDIHTIFPDFPYSIDDEPNDTWTVNELMQWCLLRSHKQIDLRKDELIYKLKQQAEEGKKELWNAQEIAMQQQFNQESQQPQFSDSNNENINPSSLLSKTDIGNNYDGKTSILTGSNRSNNNNNNNDNASKTTEPTVTKTKEPTTATNKKLKTIHIEVTDGLYKGNTYILKPTLKTPCLVGRSSSKKIRDKGISLPEDLEVSTSHGKFTVEKNKEYDPSDGTSPSSIFYYTDTGSTNGSFMYTTDVELTPNEPLQLEEGMMLQIGGTVVKIISFGC